MSQTLQEYLFKNFHGCSNHNCIMNNYGETKGGMRTNGSCTCLSNLNRYQANILLSRLQQVKDLQVNINGK